MFKLDEQEVKAFLAKNEILDYEIKKVAGDASFRSYYRIYFNTSLGDKTYILMFAPPSHENTTPFVEIDEFLISNDFSAPEIFARDEALGFLLLEDLGDDTYSRILEKEPAKELSLYKKACDCLLDLHQIEPPKDLPLYNHALLFREVMLFIDWYLPMQNKEITLQEKAQFKHLWFQLFDNLSQFNSFWEIDKKNESPVVVLRDYHADNLMVLPDRDGSNQVGLLDFQDAVIGSKAYDLVSLIEDARRDLDKENSAKIFDYYLENSNCDKEGFKIDYEILSLQRNIKIIGIFARLAIRDGKKNYLTLLPRVLNFIELRIESDNPILLELSKLIKKFI